MIAWQRKYRPVKFSQLDQEKVREFFLGVLKSGRVGQAYLFSGPKGVGKTSSARILAKTVNCVKSQKSRQKGGQAGARSQKLVEPCGKCGSCRAIESGASTAVVEIDAASNRGIDDIREIRERVGLVAGDGDFSVYIIDEVHMLTAEAFNALLKTLEEPPEHVIFCLCTTEEGKLPATVVSRCTRVGFVRASDSEIVRSLKRVVKGEGLKASDEVLAAIAGKSDGSFRDGTKMLEQLVSQGGRITLKRVEDEIGGGGRVGELLELVLEGKVKEALAVVDETSESGGDVRVLAKELVEEASSKLKEGVESGEGVDGELVALIEVFSKAFSRFRDVPIEALPLEMAVVEFGLRTKNNEQKTMNNERGSASGGGSEVKIQDSKQEVPRVTRLSERKKGKGKNKSSKESDEVSQQPRVRQRSARGRDDPSMNSGQAVALGSLATSSGENGGGELELELVEGKWGEVLSEIEKRNHGLVQLLKRARPYGCEGRVLKMQVGYKFHKEQLVQERYLSVIEEVMGGVFGSKVKLVVEVGNGEVASELKVHDNVSGEIEKADEELASAAEEIFG